MISLLQQILCAIRALAALTIDLLVESINGLILLLGLTVTALLALLPEFPAPPAAPSDGVLGMLNWVVPLAPMLTGAAVLVTLWIAFLGLRVALRWVKAL